MKKKRTSVTLNQNAIAKIDQYIDLKLKDYPLKKRSKAIEDLIDIGMKVVLDI
jgi:metal-responsive CopG/Arc/MetJ family transcriptional regulator